MAFTGAEILLKSLEAEGVDTVFGYPGGAVLPIYDALYDSKLNHILTRHEQGAAHAADGYARSTGRPGVIIATSGPGATNLITGIATAYMDSVPLVVITGQVATGVLGSDSFQEADITGITMPITKHNFLINNIDELAITVKKAFHIATTGRPGPVLIDLPKDVSTATAEFQYPETISLRSYKPTLKGNGAQIKQAAQAINSAEKPLIYAGGGVVASNAEEELLSLVETSNIPTTTTLMGLGSIPGIHPLFLGMLGMHGTRAANYAVSDCDLLIAIGARFDDRVTSRLDTFASNAKVIHIDIDPAEIGKNIKVDIPIVGDVKHVLSELSKHIEKAERDQWLDQIYKWRKEYPLTCDQDECNGRLMPQFVLKEIYESTKGEAIITTEVGQHQMWTALFYPHIKGRNLLTSGGLGTMGYGFPAAVGAQVGNKDKTVISIAGDGSFMMNMQELATIAQYELPVIIAIMNNSCLGMVRQWQELFFEKRYSQTLFDKSPDFVKLAEAFGIKGVRVSEAKRVKEVMEEAVEAKKPILIDFMIEQGENVYPMVAPGQSINNMMGR